MSRWPPNWMRPSATLASCRWRTSCFRNRRGCIEFAGRRGPRTGSAHRGRTQPPVFLGPAGGTLMHGAAAASFTPRGLRLPRLDCFGNSCLQSSSGEILQGYRDGGYARKSRGVMGGNAPYLLQFPFVAIPAGRSRGPFPVCESRSRSPRRGQTTRPRSRSRSRSNRNRNRCPCSRYSGNCSWRWACWPGAGAWRADVRSVQVREVGLGAMASAIASSRCLQEPGISSLRRSSARRNAMRAASGLPRPSMSASCL